MGRKPKAKRIEVKSSFADMAKAGMTTLPQVLVDHFKALGKTVLLVYAGSSASAHNASYARFPVYVDQLPEDLLKQIRAGFDPWDRNGGVLKRGDCIVVEQSIEARDFFEQRDKETLENQMDVADAKPVEVNDNLRASLIRHGIDGSRNLSKAQILPVTAGSIRNQAIGGPEIAARVAEHLNTL